MQVQGTEPGSSEGTLALSNAEPRLQSHFAVSPCSSHPDLLSQDSLGAWESHSPLPSDFWALLTPVNEMDLLPVWKHKGGEAPCVPTLSHAVTSGELTTFYCTPTSHLLLG